MPGVIALRPMTADEFVEWVPSHTALHAKSWSITNNVPFAEALSTSRAAFWSFLPQGLETPGHAVMVVENSLR